MTARQAWPAAALCWAAFALVVMAVHSHATDQFDHAGLLFWRRPGDPGLPRGPQGLLEAVRDATALGGPLLRNLFALGVLSALALLGAGRSALRYLLVVGGGWLVDVGLKALVGRARPTAVPHLMAVTGESFPSGHSFNSAVIYLAAALAFAGLTRRQPVRMGLIAAATAVSLLVGFTRVWLGVHYPTDVLAGWLGGAGWVFLTAAIPVRSGPPRAEVPDRP